MAGSLNGTSKQNAIRLDSSPPPPAAMDISNAPEDVLRMVLIALCQDPHQDDKAKKYLSQLNKRRQQQEKSKPDADATTTDDTTHDNGSHKRKAGSAIHVCTQCDNVFQEDENSSTACQYHQGYLGINYDSDVWDDWHEWMEQDTKENRLEYPEGFDWDCCDEDGLSEGCSRGWHSAPIPRARRAV